MGAPATDAGDTPAVTAPAKYLTAYGTFYPSNLSLEYLGDVGDALTSPQAMGITVPAGETIDVVVYAVVIGPAGAGPYALSCSTQWRFMCRSRSPKRRRRRLWWSRCRRRRP